MTIAVIAEKPAVARDIAKVIGATKKGDGFIHGNGYVITWAIGHLVSLAEPHQINAEWKKWRKDQLPMIPQPFQLQVLPKTKKQFNSVKKIISSDKVESVVCATDAGREGELIFRYIYEQAGCNKPISRLWISSLTKEAIKKGFENLKDGKDYEALSNAAKGRSQADWLVGMNLSRAYSLTHESGLSVGRVQTPTLAMLVEREMAIQNFVVEKYIELEATFSPLEQTENQIAYKGTWFESSKLSLAEALKMKKDDLRFAMRLNADGKDAKEIIARIKNGRAEIESLKSKTRKSPPPLLYDLTELQRHANRLYGISAKNTLQLAQKLYEERKLLSYPRTDSRHLSEDMAGTLPKIVNVIRQPYNDLLPENIGQKKLDKRYINDKKVTDHHAIIPTPVSAGRMKLTADEQKIYDLVCRRLLQAWMDDNISKVTTVITAVQSDSQTQPDRFLSSGTAIEQEGWKALDIKLKKKTTKKAKKEVSQELPPGLKKGKKQEVKDIEALKKQTKPPKRFTDATLLTAMETAGKAVDDKELSDAMKERGLGTPATRAAIIETLLKRGFTARSGKTFEATPKGIRLINIVHPKIKSPEMTGEWEHRLKLIEQNSDSLEDFMQQIEEYIRDVVKIVLSGRGSRNMPPPMPDELPPPPEDGDFIGEQYPVSKRTASISNGKKATAKKNSNSSSKTKAVGKKTATKTSAVINKKQDIVKRAKKVCPPEQFQELLKERFGFEDFRQYQREVCETLLKGKDALLVMPTGAGKSLCYQLPGIARAGTTLVISPLIALMEDQVLKLQKSGFVAERIHSGRSRLESRQVCVDYLKGNLDFLFIAPERLSVNGFPEMLAKNKPVLIAVDEAHCISHWGHDFRPDYRLLKDRLPLLKPAPIIATTATATLKVQRDIREQLELKEADDFICGFRRDNISIEVVELSAKERPEAVCQLLSNDALRPAIVYAPTRKKAESIAEELKSIAPTMAYHAGMTAKNRDLVQSSFLDNKLEIIVATIAFGMGIDKPDVRCVVHMAMPASLENYYQEIGRAGRDCKESKAILYYAYADRKVHEFFFDRDYPEKSVLQSLYNILDDTMQDKDLLCDKSGLTEDAFEIALEKLWVNGGAIIDPEENIARGNASWADRYKEQRSYKEGMLEIMSRYTATSACRMLKLVQHFGDQTDHGKPCGICDFCAPDKTIASVKRTPSNAEQKIISTILDLLRDADGISTGQLYQKACPTETIKRNSFEKILTALSKVSLIHLAEKTFLKDGQTIYYKRAEITADGYRFNDEMMDQISLVGTSDSSTSSTKLRRKKGRGKGKRAAASKNYTVAEVDPQVHEALKKWRSNKARQKGIPAFRVFGNRTLMQLAHDLPCDEQSLLEVYGVGPALYKKYGDSILRLIEQNKV